MNVHLWGGGGMWQYMNCLDVHVFPSHDVYLLSLTLEICKIMSHHDFEAELSAEVFNARALALVPWRPLCNAYFEFHASIGGLGRRTLSLNSALQYYPFSPLAGG